MFGCSSLIHSPEARLLWTQVVEAAIDALRLSARSIEAQGQPVMEALVAQLAGRCSEALQQLRGISMTYRMTQKPMPTRSGPRHRIGHRLLRAGKHTRSVDRRCLPA